MSNKEPHFGVDHVDQKKDLKSYLGVYVRGIAMGAADVVPGVSGGTIALITGIYDRFINGLKAAGSAQTLIELKNMNFKGMFQRIDGLFLVSLFAGILTAIVGLAGLITYLMEYHPHPLWAFFMGLVLASSGVMWKDLKQQGSIGVTVVVMLIAGFALAFFAGRMTPQSLDVQNWHFFVGGAIAICAMMLPGVSGSFLLLMMGLYGAVLNAVHNAAILQLALFAGGCAVGLLSFSHLLSWCLTRFPKASYAFLIGLMLGALEKLWPWKEVLQTRIKSDGTEVPLLDRAVSPFEFELIYQVSANIEISIAAFAVAIIAIVLLGRKS